VTILDVLPGKPEAIQKRALWSSRAFGEKFDHQRAQKENGCVASQKARMGEVEGTTQNEK
jgi:hypothetical protein